jgi:hypothetical protein
MLIEAKLILTKFFPRGVSKVNFGRYEISPSSLFSSTEVEAKLSFSNDAVSPDEIGHPEEEIDIICKLLSVFLNARIRKIGTKVDENSIPVFDGKERPQYPQFFGYFDHNAVDDLIKRTLTLNEDVARQFVRACRCYSYALDMIASDPAFSFFLLVTAGQCMASRDEVIPFTELNPSEKESERFCNFIIRYLPQELKGEQKNNEELFAELLRNAHNFCREFFITGRKEIVEAAVEADKQGADYYIHLIADREFKIPGIAWLSKIVRGALVGYLQSLPAPSAGAVDEELFSKLALEKARLK